MKKYDIALLLLHIIAVGLFFGVNRYEYKQTQETRKKYQTVVNNQDIRGVVIENVESKMNIYYAAEGDRDSWRLRGNLNQNHLDNLYIEDGVVHIENLEEGRISIMKIRRDIPLEICNSPGVKILTDEELAKKKKNKYNKRQYEL